MSASNAVRHVPVPIVAWAAIQQGKRSAWINPTRSAGRAGSPRCVPQDVGRQVPQAGAQERPICCVSVSEVPVNEQIAKFC